MEAHETHETIHEAAHHGHGGGDNPLNKRLAIMISILAALLSIVEMSGKSAQSTSMAANIDASNLWSFFQAKTIRATTLRTAAEALDGLAGMPPGLEQRIGQWRTAVDRYESDPQTGEGRKELAERAKRAEAERDHSFAAYHLFEYAASALQLAIVLCSAAAVTGRIGLAFGAGGLGVIGVVLGFLAWLAPGLLHI